MAPSPIRIARSVRGRQGAGNIADAKADNIRLRVRLLISRYFLSDGGEQIVAWKLQKIFIDFHRSDHPFSESSQNSRNNGLWPELHRITFALADKRGGAGHPNGSGAFIPLNFEIAAAQMDEHPAACPSV